MQQIWTEPLLLLLPLSQVVFSLVCSLSPTLTNGSHHQQGVEWLRFSPCSLHQETLTTVGCRTNQWFMCVGLVWADVGLPTHLHVEGLSPTKPTEEFHPRGRGRPPDRVREADAHAAEAQEPVHHLGRESPSWGAHVTPAHVWVSSASRDSHLARHRASSRPPPSSSEEPGNWKRRTDAPARR